MAKKTTNCDPIIAEIVKGTCQLGGCIQQHLNRENQNDHSNIANFQKQLCEYLNQNTNYSWASEQKPNYRTEGDSIDILGVCQNCPNYIIEIDATRGDQVAKKLLSRIALWGIEKNSIVRYIALLYPNTQGGGKSESEKFVRFGNSVLKKCNSASSCVGVYINNGKVELWDFNQLSNFEIKDKKGNVKNIQSMAQCAMAVIGDYITQNKIKNYSDLRRSFGNFVDNQPGPSRYKYLTTISGTSIYVYTQWREYGYGANWIKFVALCKRKGYFINKVW
jgi:hypothetical protein